MLESDTSTVFESTDMKVECQIMISLFDTRKKFSYWEFLLWTSGNILSFARNLKGEDHNYNTSIYIDQCRRYSYILTPVCWVLYLIGVHVTSQVKSYLCSILCIDNLGLVKHLKGDSDASIKDQIIIFIGTVNHLRVISFSALEIYRLLDYLKVLKFTS
ncbi:hypothetical protein BDB01DRAFT_833783 [Pilobolus umbonatus]|nr:hypothetical protein BDB01DRAFT_833783 [Pilobolus umbonatus]